MWARSRFKTAFVTHTAIVAESKAVSHKLSLTERLAEVDEHDLVNELASRIQSTWKKQNIRQPVREEENWFISENLKIRKKLNPALLFQRPYVTSSFPQVHLWRLHSNKLWHLSCSHHDRLSGLKIWQRITIFRKCNLEWNDILAYVKFIAKHYRDAQDSFVDDIVSLLWVCFLRSWLERTGTRWCTTVFALKEEWSLACGPLSTL